MATRILLPIVLLLLLAGCAADETTALPAAGQPTLVYIFTEG